MAQLRSLEAEGRLIYYVPKTVDRTEGRRHIWLTPNGKSFCFPQKEPAYKKMEGLANLEARMNEFVRGAALVPKIQLKCLGPFQTPDQFWEIRTPAADTHARLFGWFPAPKFFVGTHGKMRAEIRDWDKEKSKVSKTRGDLALPAFQGFSFNDYVR